MVTIIEVPTHTQGLYDFTNLLKDAVHKSGVVEGLCTAFITHTSASLIVQENVDPSAQFDLEHWINRFIPENDRHFTHTLEGPDDMPSHIKSVLTQSSISIPIIAGELTLGRWQGIFCWEHRHQGTHRKIAVHISA